MRTSRRSRIRALLSAMAISVVVSCSNASTAPEGGFAVTVSPSTATVAAGQSVHVEGTVNRDNITSSNLAISVEDTPSGITYTVSGLSSSKGTTRGTITFNVAASVSPGTYTVTVRAESSRATAAVDFTLTVT